MAASIPTWLSIQRKASAKQIYGTARFPESSVAWANCRALGPSAKNSQYDYGML